MYLRIFCVDSLRHAHCTTYYSKEELERYNENLTYTYFRKLLYDQIFPLNVYFFTIGTICMQLTHVTAKRCNPHLGMIVVISPSFLS